MVIVVGAVLTGSIWQAALLAAIGLLLLFNAIYDAKTRRLSNLATAAAALAAVGLSALASPGMLWLGIVAAALTFCVLEAFRRLFLKWRGKPGLGFGDVKLIAAVALWTATATPWVLVLASLSGLLVVAWRPGADGRIPFGPSIAAAAWIVGLGGEAHLWPLA